MWLSDLTKSIDNQEVSRTFQILWQGVRQRLLEIDLDKEIVTNVIDTLDHQFDIELQISPPYGCCFCKSGDVLQQWLEYGDKTKGVVLGFDFDWFSGLIEQMPHPNTSLKQSIGYNGVLYHNKEIDDGFYKICYDAIVDHGLSAWIMGILTAFKHYSAFIKNPTYFGEYETRIVYYPSEQHDYVTNSLNLMGPVEKPFNHYCLPWTKGNGNNALCRIGLGCNCKLSVEDIKRMLKEVGLGGRFELFNSQCSYRLR